MSRAYTPGLQISPNVTVTKTRDLPLKGRALVGVGDRVEATSPVLAADLPGELIIVKVASRMGLEAEDVKDSMKVRVGDAVQTGQLLCETKSFFGLFTATLNCPDTGVVEFFTETNAHLGIRLATTPFSVNAYISGKVVGIEEGQSVTIETQGAFLQGIFGVGGERHGKIVSLPIGNDAVVTDEFLRSQSTKLKGAVIVGGSTFDANALRAAAEAGAVAVVTGSIDPGTLRSFVGYDISVSITGDEDVPLTLMITEGFGRLPMSARVKTLADKLEGQFASVNGATQVRAGALRPEVIVETSASTPSASTESHALELKIGSSVRLIRVPFFGSLGTVSELPSEQITIGTGAQVRVLKVRLSDGCEVTVPRSNVELI